MAWTTVTNIKGPKGDPGDQGPAGSDGAQGIQGEPGADGADGTSVSIKGQVADEAALPTGADPGDGYITADTGHLWVWTDDGGGSWVDAGEIKGPKGDTGDTGAAGSDGAAGADGADGARGSKWFVGAGTPGTIAGAVAGDFYLDTTNGDVYDFA